MFRRYQKLRAIDKKAPRLIVVMSMGNRPSGTHRGTSEAYAGRGR